MDRPFVHWVVVGIAAFFIADLSMSALKSWFGLTL